MTIEWVSSPVGNWCVREVLTVDGVKPPSVPRILRHSPDTGFFLRCAEIEHDIPLETNEIEEARVLALAIWRLGWR